jgi:hypothetical protein
MRGQVWPLAIGQRAKATEEMYEQSYGTDEKETKQESTGTKAPLLHELDQDLANILTHDFRVSKGVDSESVRRNSHGLKRRGSIGRDMVRMFPEVSERSLAQEGTLYSDLQSLLERVCSVRPDLSYVQGMSFLAAVLLVHMPVAKAWQCMVNLLSTEYFESLLTMQLASLQTRFEVLTHVSNLRPVFFSSFDGTQSYQRS